MPPASQPPGGQSQYIITPWRHPSDLLDVRNNLYSPTTPAVQAHAISTVHAWKLRGNVPHAVESTALLFDAMLFHARTTSSDDLNLGAPLAAASTFALRAAYTTALSRFVTGFADLGRHKGGIGQSMFDVARTIALPAHFVELRHEVAHEEMPGLARLVRSAREAVQWLWGVYWGRLEESYGLASSLAGKELTQAEVGKEDLGLDVSEVREKVRVVLKDFRGQRVAKLKAGKGKKDSQAQAVTACEQCVSLCYGNQSREKWEEVVDVLVNEGLIVPSLKQRGPLPDSALQGAYILWDELLQQLFQSSSEFVEIFLERAIAHNAAFTATDGDQDASDPKKWAVYRWVMHIMYSDVWQKERGQGEAADWEGAILRECSLYPNVQWSSNLADEILEKASDDVRQMWGKSARASSPRDGDDEDAVGVADVSSEVEMDDATILPGGWRQEVGPWKALPIGVVGN